MSRELQEALQLCIGEGTLGAISFYLSLEFRIAATIATIRRGLPLLALLGATEVPQHRCVVLGGRSVSSSTAR